MYIYIFIFVFSNDKKSVNRDRFQLRFCTLSSSRESWPVAGDRCLIQTSTIYRIDDRTVVIHVVADDILVNDRIVNVCG